MAELADDERSRILIYRVVILDVVLSHCAIVVVAAELPLALRVVAVREIAKAACHRVLGFDPERTIICADVHAEVERAPPVGRVTDGEIVVPLADTHEVLELKLSHRRALEDRTTRGSGNIWGTDRNLDS